MNLPPTVLIKDNDFHNAWVRAVRTTLRTGSEMVIGTLDEPKPILDTCTTFELTGNAIEQIERREIHPSCPFKHIDQYCETFTREYQAEYIKKPISDRFEYVYIDRLVNHPPDIHYFGDHLWALRDHLAIQRTNEISSNRDQATTWRGTDVVEVSPPCLQRVKCRYLGDDCVEVFLTWRSRDLFHAWQSNIIALIDMLNREVIRPNGCHIVKIIDYSDSLHIYKHSIAQAEEVKLVATSPQNRL